MANGGPTGGLFCAIGSETASLSEEDLRSQINSFLDFVGERDDVLIVPPDFTRFHSRAGKLTQIVCEYYNFIPHADETNSDSTQPPNVEILPALGTHAPMTYEEITKMFGPAIADMDPSPIIVHDWRNDVVTIGHSPAEMVRKATGGMVDEPWPVQVNKRVWDRRLNNPANNKQKPIVLSIGQVVPHEVMGMAKYV
jgi:nickel-dependent lactate racemase